MADNLPEPKSRKEEFLAKAAGMDGITLPEPASREEEYLNAIAEGGGGGGGGTTYTAGDGIDITNDTISVDTTTIQPKLTAGSNVSISDNTISATDTTYSNFTGTDGTAAGTAGLVPAPATTDAGKFLKADGSWDTAGAGGPTVVQTTGTSTTDVMSQDATTKMIFPDITNKTSLIKIGNQTFSNSNASGVFINGQLVSGTTSGIAIGFSTTNPATVGTNGRASNGISIGGVVGKGDNSIAIGNNSYTYSETNDGYSVALGTQTVVNHQNSVALGSYAYTTRNGEVNVGTRTYNKGYNSTNYRVIGGVHDGIDANDAVTVGQINALIDAINSATNSSIPHIGS